MTAVERTKQGIAAYHAGKGQHAAELFIQAVQLDPSYEMAWLWLSSALDAPAEKRYCLDRALATNPQSQPARVGLAQLGNVAAQRPAALGSEPIEAPRVPPSAAKVVTPELKPKRRMHPFLIAGLIVVFGVVLAGGYLAMLDGDGTAVAAAQPPLTPAPPTPTPDPCFGALPDFFDQIEPMAREWDDANALAGQTSRISLAPQVATLQRLRRQAQDLETPDCGAPAKKHLVAAMDLTIEGYLAFLGQESDTIVGAAFKMADKELDAFTAEIARLKGLPQSDPQFQRQV